MATCNYEGFRGNKCYRYTYTEDWCTLFNDIVERQAVAKCTSDASPAVCYRQVTIHCAGKILTLDIFLHSPWGRGKNVYTWAHLHDGGPCFLPEPQPLLSSILIFPVILLGASAQTAIILISCCLSTAVLLSSHRSGFSSTTHYRTFFQGRCCPDDSDWLKLQVSHAGQHLMPDTSVTVDTRNILTNGTTIFSGYLYEKFKRRIWKSIKRFRKGVACFRKKF